MTQTLFNEDEKYEYLSFPISGYIEVTGNSSPNNPICDYCHYEDGETFTETISPISVAIYNGFNVMSEDGSTLQSISLPNGFQMTETVSAQIIKLEGEYYIDRDHFCSTEKPVVKEHSCNGQCAGCGCH